MSAKWCEHIIQIANAPGAYGLKDEHLAMLNWSFCPICGAKRPEQRQERNCETCENTLESPSGNIRCMVCKDKSGWQPRPAPVEKEPVEMVPLGPEDVPPGSVVRHPMWESWRWEYARPDTATVVILNLAWALKTYEKLQSEGWLIRRPGSDKWERCERKARR